MVGGFVEKRGSDMHSVWQVKDRRDVKVLDTTTHMLRRAHTCTCTRTHAHAPVIYKEMMTSSSLLI